MPKFGEYETFDEPLRQREASGHVIVLWRARQTDTPAAPVCVIKSCQPAADALGADAGLEFLESANLNKNLSQENPRLFAPILALGTSDVGVWYATSHYPRKSLQEFISLQGGVDSRTLAHVVYSATAGCLALQRSTGRSHGNLKPGNLLLAGKPRVLRRTPLHLIDPSPSAELQRSAPVGSREQSAGVGQISELRDLRALGELILQLVEGRLIASAYDYNFPVPAAPAWERLGKSAEDWRQWCNRLLNPQLSLGEVSLELVAKEFRPRTKAVSPGLMAGLTLVLVGTVLGASYVFSRPPEGALPAAPPAAQAPSPSDPPPALPSSVVAAIPPGQPPLQRSAAPLAGVASHAPAPIPAAKEESTTAQPAINDSPGDLIPAQPSQPSVSPSTDPAATPLVVPEATQLAAVRPPVPTSTPVEKVELSDASPALLPRAQSAGQPLDAAAGPAPTDRLLAAAPEPLSVPAIRREPGFSPIPVSLAGYSGQVALDLRFHLSVAGFACVEPDQARFQIIGNNRSAIEGQVVERATQGVAMSPRRYNRGTLRSQAQTFADDIILELTGSRGISRSPLPLEQQLDHWETVFQVGGASPLSSAGRPTALSPRLKQFCLEELTQMESAIQGDGRQAAPNAKERLAAIRGRIERLASSAPSPDALRRIEPIVAPGRSL